MNRRLCSFITGIVHVRSITIVITYLESSQMQVCLQLLQSLFFISLLVVYYCVNLFVCLFNTVLYKFVYYCSVYVCFGQELTLYTELEDINGKKHRAITIFTMAIRFLKERLLQNIKRREFNYIGEHEIRWVLTVPAMWSEKAKQYMREAAKEVWIT